MRSALAFGAILAVALGSADARADDEPSRPGGPSTAAPSTAAPSSAAPSLPARGTWSAVRAGARIPDGVPLAAFLDGVWTLTVNVQAELVRRAWDAPYPWGTVGHYTTRVLYGGSWALMLAAEGLGVIAAFGGKTDWIAEARYRTDWIFAIDLPSCPRPGAAGGCGLGAGTFSTVMVRPVRQRYWLEAGGGWFEQRVLNDVHRTVAESTAVLTPISVLYDLHTDPVADVSARVLVGPGIYAGIHAAHLHPTKRGEDVRDVPWHQMYLLDAGVGPGARIEGRVRVLRRLALEGEVVFAPLLAGGPFANVSSDVAPLDAPREGFSVWRKVGVGVGWDDPGAMPFRPSLAFYAAELSDRPLDRIGYRGVMLRFDIPLRGPGRTDAAR